MGPSGAAGVSVTKVSRNYASTPTNVRLDFEFSNGMVTTVSLGNLKGEKGDAAA